MSKEVYSGRTELHKVSTLHNWEIYCLAGLVKALEHYIRKWSSHKTDDISYLRILQRDMKENIISERERQLNKLRSKRK